jgi:mycofactocin precursor
MGAGLPNELPSAAAVAQAAAAPRKLDLSGMAPPVKLREARLEDLTIDGICGVY